MIDYKAANAVKRSHLGICSDNSLIDKLMVLDDDFLRLYSFCRMKENSGIKGKNASSLLREGEATDSIEHSLYNFPMILCQINAKLLNPADHCRKRRLAGDSWIVEFRNNHDDKVKICEEVHFIEGRLRRIDLCKDFE